MNGVPSFAVVIPFFNEERNVSIVCHELRNLLEGGLAHGEVILIDDGSSDGTGATLDEVAQSWPACRVFHLTENQGQSAALLFGFSKTTAPIIVTMDGDGQNDANEIPKLLARLQDADMVVGARMERQDSWMRRKISRIANRVRSKWLGDGVSDAGCALKVFRREVVGAFIPIRTLYSFIPSLAVAAGFRVVEEPVRHRRRQHGDSKYSVRSFLILPIIDSVGLKWFRSRHCQPVGRHLRGEDPQTAPFADNHSRLVVHRWLPPAALGLALILIALLLSRPRKSLEGPSSRKINLSQAERIALQHVPRGRLGAEGLWTESGRLIWTIDVESPSTSDIHEISIDAMNGQVIAARTESAEEEALEVAVANHRFDPKQLLPR
ncbi:MAG: glycosyltransferase [Chthoniobacterales bacterium]